MKPKQKRMAPAERLEQLTEEGFLMAVDRGLAAVNRVQLGKACGVTDGLVSRYFGNAAGMYEAIRLRAIERGSVSVLADACELGQLTDEEWASIPLHLQERVESELEQRAP